jgi:hypothetical protein
MGMQQDTTHARRARLLWGGLSGLWIAAVVGGLATLAAYDNRPGAAAQASTRWPSGSRLRPDARRPTLVMLAHPRCSCTRASLTELAELMARAPQRATAYVVFIRPARVAAAADWERAGLWDAASSIPDVTVVRDEDGREAALFHAETSGQTFLYAPDGRLLFSGGTTGARGHPGDNAGRATILALLTSGTAARSGTPVFGCSLFAPQDRPDDQDTSGTSHADHTR